MLNRLDHLSARKKNDCAIIFLKLTPYGERNMYFYRIRALIKESIAGKKKS